MINRKDLATDLNSMILLYLTKETNLTSIADKIKTWINQYDLKSSVAKQSSKDLDLARIAASFPRITLEALRPVLFIFG